MMSTHIINQFIECLSFEDICTTFSYYDMIHTFKGDGFMYATPKENSSFIPFLLHSQLTDGIPVTNVGSAVIYDAMKHNIDHPPFVLLTEGKHGLKNFIKTNILDHVNINVIVSVNGNKAYSYEYYSHTPYELIEALPPWSTRTRSSASLLNETLQAAYNIPGVVIHPNLIEGQTSSYDSKAFDTAVTDVQTVLTHPLPSFNSYMYSPVMSQASSRSGTGTATLILPQCDCCGKRVPTKYFWRIHSNICAKCTNRIKALGTVSILTFGQAKYMLESQRALTRHANACNTNNKCPICYEGRIAWNRLDSQDSVGACGNCGNTYFHKNWKEFFFLIEHHVYQYVGRKIINMCPLEDHPIVRSCYVCGSITTQGGVSVDVGDTRVYVCDECGKLEAMMKYY